MTIEKRLSRFIRNYEERCECDNEHSDLSRAQDLANVLLKYVSPAIALKILKETL